MAERPGSRPAVRLITIVAEAVLRDRLIDDLHERGATGYTLTEAHGEGSRGRRVGDVEGANVRIESLVSAETAEAMLARLEEAYFPHYAVVAWVEEVRVVRGDKYV